MFDDNATTARTLRNIKKTLEKSLKDKYNIDNENISNGLLNIHGIDKKRFDFVNCIETIINGTLNDVSIDANSNKNEKTVEGVYQETFAPIKKAVGFDYLYRTMKELYGKEEAKRLSGEMYDLSLGLSDSTNILRPYCWALDASKIVTVGRDFGQLHSAPAKHVSSYISALCETIHEMSSHLAGAIAISSFFADIAHLLIYKDEYTLHDILFNKHKRKIIENEIQQFIHSVNLLSRNGAESPFTNISIFDGVKIRAIINEMNWYFPLDELKIWKPKFKNAEEETEHCISYIVDFIKEIQNIFFDIYDKGDPLKSGIPYRFPVCFPEYENLVINNEIKRFDDCFKDFKCGWTDVEKNCIYTEYNGKPTKINKVYKSHSSKFIKITGTNGKTITVTPDHKFPLINSNILIEAKNLKRGDRIDRYIVDSESLNDKEDIKELDVSEIISNLRILGYKIHRNTESKDLFCKNGLFDENIFDHDNHNKSHDIDIINKLEHNIENFMLVPNRCEVKVKTSESKQKGAISRYIKLDYDFGRFLGLYYAEGHNSNGELGLSFNVKEIEYIRFVQDYLKKLGISSRVINNKKGNGCQVVFFSRTLGLLLDKIIGVHSYNKVFNFKEIKNMSNEMKVGFLAGVIEGDGHVNKYSIIVTTVSSIGSECIQYIASSLGILSTAGLQKGKYRKVVTKFVQQRDQYLIKFNKKTLKQVFNKYNKTPSKFNNLCDTKRNGPVIKGFYVRKVEAVNCAPENYAVYNIEVDNDKHIFTLPCGVNTSNCTVNLSKSTDNKENELVGDESFLRQLCKRDIFRYNLFVSSGTKIASCCRLLSNRDMLELASQANSFGAGGSMSLGSHRVCTIDFPRIVLESKSKEDFFTILEQRIESSAKILKAHKQLIKKLTDKGLQKFLSKGWININRLFSTFGLIGLYEASSMLKEKFCDISKDEDIEGSMLVSMNNFVTKYSEKYGIIGNIEQIPGESFAIKLLKADKLIFGDVNLPYNLYSNQFIPLWKDATLWEKLDADGKYNKLITGGGIVHAQIGEKVTAKQAEKIIKYAVNSGCEHFALNAIYSECEDGHVSFGKFETCPICSKNIVEKYTRVVGFFTPVSSWQDVRRNWEFDHRTFVDLNQDS